MWPVSVKSDYLVKLVIPASRDGRPSQGFLAHTLHICTFDASMTWNKCAVLLWGLTFASNCVDGSVRHRHRIRAQRRQIRLERIRRGWSKVMVRKNNCPRIEQSRRTEGNNVSDLHQFLKSRFANATTGDLRSQCSILVEYIQSKQYLSFCQKHTRIDGTVWFSTCVVKKWSFCSRCEKIDTLDGTYRGMV